MQCLEMDTFSRIRRSRARGPSWSDAHLSIGQYIGKVGRDCCWEATGPAREAFVKLGPEIKSCLDKRSEPLPSWVTYSVYMVGGSPRTASPTIIFCASDSTLRREVRRIVKDSGLLARYPGLRTGDMARAPDFNQLVQLATEDVNQNELNADSESRVRSRPTVYTLPSKSAPGMQMYIQSGADGSRRVVKTTVGGIVEFSGKSYYFTAGHAFQNRPDPFTSQYASVHDQGLDIDGQSDPGDRSSMSVDEDVDVTSRGSFTPDYASSESGLSSDDDLSSISSSRAESVDEPLVAQLESDVTTMSDNRSETTIRAEDSLLPPLSSLVNAGDLYINSFDIADDSLDYALVELPSCFVVSNEVETVEGEKSRSFVPSMVNRIGLIDAHIVAATGSRGPVTGRLSGTSSFMCLPGNRTCQEVYTVHLNSSLENGDCGSWVMDADTGHLYGHIVAGAAYSGVAYVIPAHEVFERIGTRLGGILRLPSPTAGTKSKYPVPPCSSPALLSENDQLARDLTSRFRKILSTRRISDLERTVARYRNAIRPVPPGAPPPYQPIEGLLIYRGLRNIPVMPQAPQDGLSLRFRNYLATVTQAPSDWEKPALLDEALEVIPTEKIYNEAEEEAQVYEAEAASLGAKRKPAWGYQDCVIRALLRWFKRSFFTWVNHPPCSKCLGPTVGRAMVQPTPDEQACSAEKVELYQCSQCNNLERFPRYMDAFVLLQTRRGRVGEWANCFGMLCRAVGSRVRWVWNPEDHVWLEVYSVHRKRWVHVDACEEAWDRPRLYTEGWGTKFSYCIAFSIDGVTDVTSRYVRNPIRHGLPRSRTSESALLYILQELTAKLRSKASPEQANILKLEDIKEQHEFRTFILSRVASELIQLKASDVIDPPPARRGLLEVESAEERKQRQERFHEWILARYDISGTEDPEERTNPNRDVR